MGLKHIKNIDYEHPYTPEDLEEIVIDVQQSRNRGSKRCPDGYDLKTIEEIERLANEEILQETLSLEPKTLKLTRR